MMRTLLIILVATAALSGCVADDDDSNGGTNGGKGGIAKTATNPLWNNPETFPHPDYNFPTLTNPLVPAPSKWWVPIASSELPATIGGLERVAGLDGAAHSGAGMCLFGSLQILPANSAPTYIVSLENPLKPEIISEIPLSSRGCDTIAFPSGQLFAVLATGGGTLYVYDITDPTNPVEASTMVPPTGTHKVSVLPGTPFVYNAGSNGGGPTTLVGQPAGATEIYDLSDPFNPVLVQSFENGFGCHHIYFYNNLETETYRTFCAGIEATQIWDTTDPSHPVIVATIPFPHGISPIPSTGTASPAALSHFAIANLDYTVLVVGDETGGGIAPGCDVYVETPLQTVSGPLGNLWFYDITDEANPTLLGFVSPQSTLLEGTSGLSCTAHHGRLIPASDGSDVIAMAFYGQGVVLIDFSDPTSATIEGQFNEGTNTWEAWYYNGYIITGDLSRGMDVLKVI